MPTPINCSEPTRVEVLCGAPRAEVRSALELEREAIERVGGSATADCMRSSNSGGTPSDGSTRSSARATSSEETAPPNRQQLAPLAILLAEHPGWMRRPVERLLEVRLDERQLVLDDEHRLEPSANSRSCSLASGHGIESCTSRSPGFPVLAVESESASARSTA